MESQSKLLLVVSSKLMLIVLLCSMYEEVMVYQVYNIS